MRLPAFVTCASLVAASAGCIFDPGSASALPSGPDRSLCDSVEERVEIPADFPLDACFDGVTLHIANRTALPLQLSFEGDRGEVTKHQLGRGASVTARLLNDAYSFDPGWLVPGYRVAIPVGAGALDVEIHTDDERAKQYVYTDLLARFFPPAAVSDAIIEAANELMEVYDQHVACLGRSGWLGDIGCEALYLRNVGFAFTRAGVNAASGVVGLVAGALDQAADAETWVSDAVDLAHGTTTLHVSEATAPLTSEDSPDLEQLISRVPEVTGYLQPPECSTARVTGWDPSRDYVEMFLAHETSSTCYGDEVYFYVRIEQGGLVAFGARSEFAGAFDAEDEAVYDDAIARLVDAPSTRVTFTDPAPGSDGVAVDDVTPEDR